MIENLPKVNETGVYEHQLLSAMAAYGSVPVWLIDKDFNLKFANKAFYTYFTSFSDSEKIGVLFENEELTYSSIARVRKVIYPRVLAGESLQVTVRLPDQRYVKTWMAPARNKEDEINAIACWGFDVTDEMLSKFSLVRSEKKFRNIFESLQDIFFRCNVKGEILMVNPAVAKILGYQPRELLGRNIKDYYLYLATTRQMFQHLVKHKELKNFEVSLVHKSGKIIPSICSINLMIDEDGFYIEGIARDIAEIKKTNEELEHAIQLAERSLKVKERFLANMSHEIKTPLNGIIGMVNVLQHSPLNIEQSEQVQAIKHSSEVLLKLLNNLLDRSRLELGKMPVQLAPVSPQQVVEKVLLIYRQRAVEKNINLSFSLDEKLPDYVMTDEVKVIQILSNLISNAIKFTGRGGDVSVKATAPECNDDFIKIHFVVQDTGIGIKEEEKRKVFQSFIQLDNEENKRHEGTGLGLSISKELTLLLGGEIGVQSEPGKGSAFWFMLKTMPAQKKQHKKVEMRRLEKLDYHPHVLVVDDNRINRDVATKILQNAGAETSSAGSGKQAMTLIEKGVYDVILMDIQMPDMSGVDLMEWMKENILNLPPVIALTAYDEKDKKDKFLSMGFVDFIGKPIDPEHLLTKIREWTIAQDLVIDEDVLNKLTHYGGEEMVEEAMNEFSEDTEKQIKECFVLLSDQNHKGILDILHAIKGNAATLGVNKLARRAMQMEEHLKKGYIIRIKEELKQLEHYFREFKAYYVEKN